MTRIARSIAIVSGLLLLTLFGATATASASQPAPQSVRAGSVAALLGELRLGWLLDSLQPGGVHPCDR